MHGTFVLAHKRQWGWGSRVVPGSGSATKIFSLSKHLIPLLF
jgi:hypothetical protein